MSYLLPKRPASPGYDQKMWDIVNQLATQQTAGARISRTTRGVIEHVAEASSSAKQQASGLNYRGAWSTAEDYVIGDVVVVPLVGRPTDDGGTFVCVVDAPAGSDQPVNPYVYPNSIQSSGNWDVLSGDRWPSYVAVGPDANGVLANDGMSIIESHEEGATNFRQILIRLNDMSIPGSPFGQDIAVKIREINFMNEGSQWKMLALACEPVFVS